MPRLLPRAIAAASCAQVAEVATAVLARGNAVDAVVAAVFAAAALEPSVLLGPLQMLIGGAGAGLRAIDGRVRQPGLGLPRPRGFLSDQAVLAAARVAVPALPAAAAAALATFGGLALAKTLAPALELAQARSTARLAVLRRISQRGPAALVDALVAGELVANAGRVAGGVLSQRDLEEVRPAVATCSPMPVGRAGVVTVPWGAAAVRDPKEAPVDGSNARVLVCVDRRGLIAVACYEVSAVGLDIPPLDLLAPANAAPVMRGERRVRAGTPRPASAPIALVELGDRPVLGVGAEREPAVERVLGLWLQAQDGGAETCPPMIVARRPDIEREGWSIRA